MRQVAALAGVGIKTVSRVVNGEPNVSEAMIQRVQEAVHQLDYQHDVNASNLKRANGRTLTLGLLAGGYARPFSGAVQQGIEQKAWERDTAVFAASLGCDPDRGPAIVRTFLRRRVDGMILAGSAGDGRCLAAGGERRTPVVFIGQAPPEVGADAVTSDNFAGAAKAARHLLGHGHRRIAYCCTGGRADLRTARERQRGFMEELRRAGIEAAEVSVLQGLDDAEQARDAVATLLRSESPPTAVFASDSIATIGAMRALRGSGQADSVALVGFDDFALPELADPWVTVVTQEPESVGRVAAERLFARIDGSREEPRTYTVPTTLIARGSGELRARV